jgi:hypothetical protein
LIQRLLLGVALIVIAVDVAAPDGTRLPPNPDATESSSTEAGTDATSTPVAGADVIVLDLTGDEDTNASGPFVVAGRWELRWTVNDGGPGVAVTIEDHGGGRNGGFEALPPGTGAKAFDGGCNCTISAVPDGTSYDVVVVDLAG